MILIDQKYKKKSIKGWFKENGFFLCLVALPVLQFLIMYVYVNLNSFVMAFRSYSVDEGWGWAGFDNFNEVFRQFESANLFKHAFNNSLIAFAMMLPFDLVGVFFSYYIFKKFAAWKLFRNILFLPQILSAGVLILMFDNFGDTFICVALENWFGIETGGTLAKNPEYGFYVMIIYNIFMSFGTAVIMYTNAMSNIDESVLEASKLDGASDFVEFFKIVLPQIISVFSVFLTIRIASIFVGQYNMYPIYGSTIAKDNQYTIGFYIFKEIKIAQNGNYSKFPYIATIGFLVTCITAPMVFLTRYLFKKLDPMESNK